ncbi:MAG TPA: peptidoglycan-binding protein [Cyanobacteria bacterium UBA8553]|nr:peptidoglycan-binding protein [Cyanobacteria bacterium UBA8553]
METLAYFHLTVAHEASTNLEPETASDEDLFFLELNLTQHLSGASASLLFFALALLTLCLASPALALEQGSKGSQVTSLQKKLQAAGYFNGEATGYYGSVTQAAVIKFQKDKGLKPDGVVGEQTLKALESNSGASAPSTQATPPQEVTDKPSEVSSSPVTLQKGSKSSQVTALQKKLQAAGYFDGPVTGYFGSLTQAAVIELQKAKGLNPSGIVDTATLTALESSSGASPPSKTAASQKESTDETQKETQNNLDKPEKASPTPQSNLEKGSPAVQKTPQKASPTPEINPEEASPELQKTPEKTSANQSTGMKLKKTIYGKISPKSVVYSGNGLFFAQNMMYSHTITVYDRNHNLVKTIPDAVDLSKFGFSKLKGNYKGAPVEASFSGDGKYAWVSNYQMYGAGFNNPGSDVCSPSERNDKSFLYRINTENLNVDKVIQVGAVPKYVATSPDDSFVLVSNWCSFDLSVVDPEENREIKRIKLGRYPRGIVVDGESENAYVAVMGSSDIAKVKLDDFSVKWLKNVGRGPRHLNIDPAGKYLYATLNNEGRVAKIDLSTGKVLKKVSTGNAPRSMVISDDGQHLYVVNYNSNTVSKVRTSNMKVLQNVNVNANPIGITYDPETREVWVACYSGSIMVFKD